METQQLTRRKRKMLKKKRLKQQSEIIAVASVSSVVNAVDGEKKKFSTKLRMALELGLDTISDRISETEESRQPETRTPWVKGREPDVVVFPKYVKKTTVCTPKDENKDEALETSKGYEFSVKKARHEVMKFGFTGFEKSSREDAKITYAVSKGAKPPKRKYLHYKELMEQRKKEKLEIEQQKKGHEMLRKVGSRQSSKKMKRRKVHSS